MIQDRDQVAGEGQSRRITAWMAVMTQPYGEVRTLAQQAIGLYAVARGNLDSTAGASGVSGVEDAIRNLWKFCEAEIPDIVAEINETQDIQSGSMDVLGDAIDRFMSSTSGST
eukprot:CAMPEP_0170184320 /NCGR_PEP_ID=MMETSP0040_2-20121228/33307_1 /TAXON_ID=641309 /ORGANISM="Lotharella oceanica, Strain CCMP622" /LENGTH=112 /DNA_ID=CAMNT_0010430341 /DNA_START=36 /DNA_END=374 /DNA_ORIENTATION=-